jgi:hypothetical protein
MRVKKNPKASPSQKPNSNRHESHCKICAHPQRAEIERAFIDWVRAPLIVAKFKLGDRTSIYRHAAALNLDPKRDRNVAAPLREFIERAHEAPVTGSALIQAIKLLAQINGRGELVEPVEQIDIRDLFSKMTDAECEAYAKDGALPSWFTQLTGKKGPKGSGGNENA